MIVRLPAYINRWRQRIFVRPQWTLILRSCGNTNYLIQYS